MQTLGDRTKTGWPLLICLGLSGVTFFLPWVEIKVRYVGERQSFVPDPLRWSSFFGALAGELLSTQRAEVKTLYQSGADASQGTVRADDPRRSGWDQRAGPIPWNPLGAQPRAGMVSWSPLAAAYGLLLLGAFGCWCWLGERRGGKFAVASCLALGVLCLVLIPGADGPLRTAIDEKTPSTIRAPTPRQTNVRAKAPPNNSGNMTRQSITIEYGISYYGAVATTLGALAAALLISLRRGRPQVPPEVAGGCWVSSDASLDGGVTHSHDIRLRDVGELRRIAVYRG